ARRLPAGPRGDRGAGGRAAGGGPAGPEHARGEPGKVAPGAHDVVLRDLRAPGGAARPAPVPPGLRAPVQLVLRRGRAAVRPPAPGPVDAPDARRGAALPRR